MTDRPIVLVGGGRWGRVLLTVLAAIEKSAQIVWISKYGYERNQLWLAEQGFSNVSLQNDEQQMWKSNPKAIIEAVGSWDHACYIQQSLDYGLPIYSEKPFAMDSETAKKLINKSKSRNIVAGVNLEFSYASYLHDFKELLSDTCLRNMEVIWHDPFVEFRNGEIKYSDIYTPLVHDLLPHCWSLLNILSFDPIYDIDDVKYSENSTVTVYAHNSQLEVTLSLNRRADERKRRIIVNSGYAVLDFTKEPGFVTIGGERRENIWSGRRPLSASLGAFLLSVNNPSLHLQTNLESCYGSVEFAEKSFEALQIRYRHHLDAAVQAGRLNAEDLITRNIIMDMLVPQLAANDRHFRAPSPTEIDDFTRYVLNNKLLWR